MTGSEMAKAGLLEQNRLSGANRNTLIAGGIMANTAEIFNFPVPDAAQKEPRVADLDDGYTRIANELLEAVMLAGLSTADQARTASRIFSWPGTCFV